MTPPRIGCMSAETENGVGYP